jgi:hypothetical protein
LGGNPATTYKVHVRFCAVFEGLGYTACMTNADNAANPAVCVDGTRPTGGNPGTYPTLGIRVAAPAHVYYLNRQAMYLDEIFQFGSTVTFDAQGGTTVTLISDGGSGDDVFTANQSTPPPACPTRPVGIAAGYLGQYFHVESVTTDPPN